MSIAPELPTVEVDPELAWTPAQRGPGAAEALDLADRDAATAQRLHVALTQRLDTAPLTNVQRVLKRTLDVLGAAVLLLLLLPVLGVAAVAVRLDTPGPVLFAQERIGRGGRTFRILKLRSMSVGNDDSAHRAYVARLVRGEADAEGGVFKLVSDPRVTRVGRVIRRYSVDELPQLWNVLRGDMSLVGPRPALPDEVALYDSRARQRLAVKPGVTGLWQVSGRCELSFQQMIDLDVSYWQRWSLVRDLHILARTPLAALSGRGAA
jgi:lipopolysaccharide/colanic/teichoic acid biosynthesis glycosyltransferase